ncbi:hypothetical protein ACFL21_04740 [Patescibacteria group bacterium]
MSLDSFVGFEGGEGMDEGAFEAFKEKMKRAAAQIAAIKKEEGKQKKKEQELLKILLAFIKKSYKTELVLLISRALAQNLPANFILAIILLGNEDIQEKAGKYLLPPGFQQYEQAQLEEAESGNSQALVFFNEDKTMPLKIKIQIEQWLKVLMIQAEENPQKLLRTAYDIEKVEIEGEEQKIKKISKALINLATYIVKDFLKQNNQVEPNKQLRKFTHFILKGILSKTKEALDNREVLEGTISESV